MFSFFLFIFNFRIWSSAMIGWCFLLGWKSFALFLVSFLSLWRSLSRFCLRFIWLNHWIHWTSHIQMHKRREEHRDQFDMFDELNVKKIWQIAWLKWSERFYCCCCCGFWFCFVFWLLHWRAVLLIFVHFRCVNKSTTQCMQPER